MHFAQWHSGVHHCFVLQALLLLCLSDSAQLCRAAVLSHLTGPVLAGHYYSIAPAQPWRTEPAQNHSEQPEKRARPCTPVALSFIQSSSSYGRDLKLNIFTWRGPSEGFYIPEGLPSLHPVPASCPPGSLFLQVCFPSRNFASPAASLKPSSRSFPLSPIEERTCRSARAVIRLPQGSPQCPASVRATSALSRTELLQREMIGGM